MWRAKPNKYRYAVLLSLPINVTLQPMNHSNVLAVMVRAPKPGQVKTRLVPPLSFEEAAGLYRAFIVDTLDMANHIPCTDIFAACTPRSGLLSLSNLIPEGISITIQKDVDLGARIYGVFEDLFARGFERVAIIGSDSPDMPTAFITNAFRLLEENPGKVVLGPATDGGYYLIAMDGLTKVPFEDMEWGSETVFDETVARLGGDLLLLPEWHDIDRPEDILLLDESAMAPESARFIAESGMIKRYGLK